MGPISTFGSVVVNGVRYDTSSAVFTVNGLSGSQDDLSVGQVITVSGTIDGLSVDNIVEVSGLVAANGDITATCIELKPAGTEFEVLGIVSALDSGNMLFNINDPAVDYSGATLDNDFPGGQINDGDFVEAKGMSLNFDREFVATEVDLKNALPDVADGVHVEIQGFITRFDSLTDFDVTGLPVTTTASTVYEGGVEGDLGLDIKVEVEGDVNSSGVLVATKVDIRSAKAVRAAASSPQAAAIFLQRSWNETMPIPKRYCRASSKRSAILHSQFLV